MPYQLRLSYRIALNGEYKRRWSHSPDFIGAHLAERGATIIHNSIYLPKIDFTNGKHVDNIIDLLSAARDIGYDEAMIELDDSESRTLIFGHFIHKFVLPGIFIRMQENNDKTIMRAQLFKGVSSIIETEVLALSMEEIENMIDDAVEEAKSKGSNVNIYDGLDEEARKRLREIANTLNEIFDEDNNSGQDN